jgi:Flp pilus assembly protein CpaB
VIVAGLLAVLVNFALLRSREESFLVAVADRDLVSGTTATDEAFRLVEVRVGPDVLDTLVVAEELADLTGRIVARSVAEGELITDTDFVVAAAPLEQRAMSIPVDPVHAAGGVISGADVVDVVAVRDGVAEYIVVAAPVLDVAPSSTSGLGSSGQFYVTLAVDSVTALRLAAALDVGSIEVIRSTGAVEPTQSVFPEPPDPGEPADTDPEGDSGAGS